MAATTGTTSSVLPPGPSGSPGPGPSGLPGVSAPAVPFTVKTAAAMGALYITLGLMAETQAADLAAALAWAIAVSVVLLYGRTAIANLQGMIA